MRFECRMSNKEFRRLKFPGLLAFTSIESGGCCVGAGTGVALLLLLGDSLLDIGYSCPSPAAETATSPAGGRGDMLVRLLGLGFLCWRGRPGRLRLRRG